MFLSQRISLEQKQTLIMTPQLQQAIQLLQYSALELGEYIEEELKSNPVLETSIEESKEEKFQTEENNFWDNYIKKSDLSFDSENKIDSDLKDYNYENFVTAQPTLSEHLLLQFNLTINNPNELEIGEFLIGCLDANGFLSIPIDEMAQSLNVTNLDILKILEIIQTLDPIGVAARDLKESLMIQSKFYYGEMPLVEKIIQNHLDELGRNKIKEIAHKLKVQPQEIQKATDLIKTLNPRPAMNFSTGCETKYLKPDVFIQKVEEDYVVIMNDNTVPRLKINSYYRSILKKFKSGEETREFLEKKLNSALWLIKSIEQRRMTIYRIVETLIELQRPFLDCGIKHLQPMVLSEVAEKIDVHESTVSRATTNKYVQTPQGIFELKFFFNSGISGTSGDGLSSVSVKKIINDLIKEEDSTKPLSDQKISELIGKRGYTISRRTVAKYRDELRIPSSSKRRRYE
ncbi:MAG: RNA polymerase factor sigma-54 [Halanaerobiales bacterium]|nr:RNA polymerase factor sigma-54 [Halanaerobiales bacterium]